MVSGLLIWNNKIGNRRKEKTYHNKDFYYDFITHCLSHIAYRPSSINGTNKTYHDRKAKHSGKILLLKSHPNYFKCSQNRSGRTNSNQCSTDKRIVPIFRKDEWQ